MHVAEIIAVLQHEHHIGTPVQYSAQLQRQWGVPVVQIAQIEINDLIETSSSFFFTAKLIAMAFDRTQHLIDVFADADLPSVVNLGLYVLIDDAWAHCNEPNFAKLSSEQFQQLVSKLRKQTHVIVLNLGAACVGHTPGPVMCEHLVAAFGRPTDLRVLQLGGAACL